MAKYGKGASKRVESAVRRQKHGTLKSGSGGRVRSRKQAIAIGLSEAREKGAKVPPPPGGRAGGRKSAAKKRSTARSRSSSATSTTRKTRKTTKTGTRKTSRAHKTRGSRKR